MTNKEEGVGWDALVIDAVCAHYGLDGAALSLPPKARKEAEKDAKAEDKADKAAGSEEAGK